MDSNATPYEYELIKGLTDRQIRILYKEVRQEMKARKLLIYDSKQDLFVPNYPLKTKSKPVRSQRKSKGIFVAERYRGSLTGTFDKKMLGSFNSVLTSWLREDWSFLFTEELDRSKSYYVYYHCDPSSGNVSFSNGRDENKMVVRFNGLPFYIGKGTGKRYVSMKGRCTAHVERVKHLESLGHQINGIAFILCDGLTEAEALEMESKLIAFFGCMGELPTDIRHFYGGRGGCLVNADVGRRPEWVKELFRQKVEREQMIRQMKSRSKSSKKTNQ